MRHMLATPCVILSLALSTLGGSNPTGGFHLGTLSIAGPSAIMGPILDSIAVSRDVEGMLCEELGWHARNHGARHGCTNRPSHV
jgi:hypothetical protein